MDGASVQMQGATLRTARGLYRIAKGYVTLDAGDNVRTHLGEMKRTLVRAPRRKRNAGAPDTSVAAKK